MVLVSILICFYVRFVALKIYCCFC